MQKRYQKNHNTISIEEQKKLFDKTVTIIGCGGLGQYIASQLCRIGLGQLRIVDPDVFDETNLNRQLFCNVNNLGLSKVIETEKRLKEINPETVIVSYCEKFSIDNAQKIIAKSDVVIDALDNIADRLVLEKSCKQAGITLISAAIGGWYGQLTVVNPGDNTLSKIYKNTNAQGIEKELGNPAFTPALLASMQVAETIKFLLEKPTLPSNTVLYIDLLNHVYETYSLNSKL